VFDLGVSKLAVIGVVALVVIGPERLPKVARTIGTLLGRAQRYLADVKAEVNREMQIDELRAMRDHVQKAASSFESSVHDHLRETRAQINAEASSVFETDESTPRPGPQMMPLSMSHAAPMPRARRDKWKRNVSTRQTSMPMWFKHANRKRTRVQSGAARVARYRVHSRMR
jgi:sec-independent protein translocase protein TatB